MRIKSFKLLNLALLGIKNVASSTICAGASNGTPVVAVGQPGSVENCGVPSQPLVYDSSTTGQNGGGNQGFTPECLVPGLGGNPGTPGGFSPVVQQIPATECVPVANPPPSQPSITTQIVQPPPVMATTIIGPPPGGNTPGNNTPGNNTPGNSPPGTPGNPTGGNPPGGSTPPPKQETQCTVTTKLDCEPVTPGAEGDNNPPADQPPSEQPPTNPSTNPPTNPPNGPPAQTTVVHHVTESVPPQPRVVSIVPPPPVRVVTPPPQPIVEVPRQVNVPPSSFIPSNTPMVCSSPNGGIVPGVAKQQVGGGSPRPGVPVAQVQPTCIAPPTTTPPTVNNVGTPTTTLGTGSGVPVPATGPAPACSTPQNALSALCGSNNATSTTPYASSNVGAACALPNAEGCLTKALENIGKVTPYESAACVTTTKQPMVEVGMMLPASEKYVQAYNNPCVLS